MASNGIRSNPIPGMSSPSLATPPSQENTSVREEPHDPVESHGLVELQQRRRESLQFLTPPTTLQRQIRNPLPSEREAGRPTPDRALDSALIEWQKEAKQEIDPSVISLLQKNPTEMEQHKTLLISDKGLQEFILNRLQTKSEPEKLYQMLKEPKFCKLLRLMDNPKIRNALTTKVRGDKGVKTILSNWIELSKTKDVVSQAAADAITILVKAYVNFNSANFSKIKIPGADLSGGLFEDTQLQGADLTGVKFYKSWLRRADFSGAQMAGAQFGEYPCLQTESIAWGHHYSPDGKTCAVGFADDTIGVYDPSTWEKICSLNSGPTNYFTYLPSGQQIVSASEDGTVRLWDVETRAPGRILEGHADSVEEIKYSPNGEQIASASKDKTVRLWDVKTGKPGHILEGHTKAVNSIAYLQSGEQIASASEDGTVRLWDVKTGKLDRILECHTSGVNRILCSPDGQQIASASQDGTVRLWNVKTGEPGHILGDYAKAVADLVSSSDGQHIASARRDTTVSLGNAKTGEAGHILEGHPEAVYDLAYSPDGQYIALARADTTVSLWSVTEGGPAGLAQNYQANGFAFSPDSKQFALGTMYGQVCVLKVGTGEPLGILDHSTSSFTGKIKSVTYSPDGQQIVSAGEDKTLRMRDAPTTEASRPLRNRVGKMNIIPKLSRVMEIAPGEDKEFRLYVKEIALGMSNIINLTYSPSGEQIVASSKDGMTRMWEAYGQKLLVTIKSGSIVTQSITYSPQGGQIAWGDKSGVISVQNTKDLQRPSPRILQGSQGNTNSVTSLTYSQDGKYIASGSADGTVQLLGLAKGTLANTLKGHTDAVNKIMYSPDNQHIASASVDGTVRLWEIATGKLTKTLEGHTGAVNNVAYSQNGKQIASASEDGEVRLWNVETGELDHILKGHTGAVNSIVYLSNDDEELIASGGNDRTLQIWEVASGQLVETVQDFHESITHLAWSKTTNDETYLITGSLDKTVRWWQVRPEKKNDSEATEKKSSYKAYLKFSAGPRPLAVTGALFEKAQGLSPGNQAMLEQRGAVVTPPPSPTQNESRDNL